MFNPQQYKGQVNSALFDALSGRPAYNLRPGATANYFQDSVVTPAMRAYDRQIKPRINEAFNTAGNGVFSSRQSEAQAQALTDIQVGFGSQLANLQYQNQALEASLMDNAANRQLQGIGQAINLRNQPLLQAGLLQQLAQPYQQNQQLKRDVKYQEYLRTQPYANPYLQLGLQTTGVNAVTPYLQQNPLGQVGPLLGAGIGGLGAALTPGGMGFGSGALFGGLLGGLL